MSSVPSRQLGGKTTHTAGVDSAPARVTLTLHEMQLAALEALI